MTQPVDEGTAGRGYPRIAFLLASGTFAVERAMPAAVAGTVCHPFHSLLTVPADRIAVICNVDIWFIPINRNERWDRQAILFGLKCMRFGR
jgi:hypothetical protein